jgi:uracil-DNA glycosylase family 4
MSNVIIPPDGPLNAFIAVIGQNPGKTEINPHVLKPFQGYSGNLLKKWWSMLSPPLHREDIYVDNLVPYMCDPEKLEEQELRYWEDELHKRLARLTQVRVIVPTGNYACYPLVGKGNVKGASRKNKVGITLLRGSIYEYTNPYSTRTCKVIPTLHPSALFQRDNSAKMGVTKGILEKRVFKDWERIARESMFEGVRKPERKYFIDPLESDVAAFTHSVEEAGDAIALAVDIETPSGALDCVGFSVDPSWSITVPTFTNRERDTFLPYIKRLCESSAQKVLQNGLFDTYWLANLGIGVENWLWDLMYMHVVVDPVNNHSLDFLSSVYLPYHQYWKDHAKSDDDAAFRWTESKEDLLTYNGMDCCVSRELLSYVHEDLVKEGLLDYYLSNVQPLFKPLLDISLHGIRVNRGALVKLRTISESSAAAIREELKLLAGEDLISKSGLSPIKLKKFFHITLGLPKQYKLTKKKDGKSRSVSLDATNLAKLAYRFKSAAKPAQLVVDYRARMKELESWLNEEKLDADGRVRAQYRPVTEACRLASSAHPMGKAVKPVKAKGAPRRKKGDPLPEKLVDRGYNLQNTKRELREIYVPDEGCLLLEIDASQIEDRYCKMYTRAPRMIELANMHPTMFDVHTHNAALIFGISESLVDKAQRFLGKVTSHGAERGMTGKKLSEQLLANHDMLVSPDECQKMIDKFLDENWEIRDVFFPWVRQEILSRGRLVNSWGAVWDVRSENLDDDLYRRGYSFPMQSECACLVNAWGLVPVQRYLKDNYNRLKSSINIPRHDALIMSVPFEHLYEVCVFTLGSMERPRMILGNWLTVPCTIKVGKNDAGGVEFKALPRRDEFMQRVEEYISTN